MNLSEFQRKTEQMIVSMNEKELMQFIYKLTRKVPEGKREEFITMLMQSGGSHSIEEQAKIMQRNKSEEQKIQEEFEQLKNNIGKIQEGEMYIHAYGYEQGYWGDNWKYEYEDPEGVGNIYENGCRLLVRCVNTGLYAIAEEIFNLLWKNEVSVDDEGDGFTLSVEEMVSEKLISVNLENLALYVWYAVYQASSKEERVKNLYAYLSVPIFKHIQLEKLMQIGNAELTDFDDFLEEWIEFLSTKNGNTEEYMLKDALSMHCNSEEILKIARRVSNIHPSLYLEVLKTAEKNHDYERVCIIGTEAMEQINKEYVIRSNIALLVAEAALRQGDEDKAKECLWEAFVSDSTPVSFLRLILNTSNPSVYINRASSVLHNITKSHENNCLSQELKKNNISDMDLSILEFLLGDFETSMNKCLNIKKSLGWSGSFVKCGIALFLLLLVDGEGLGSGCRRMLLDAEIYMGFKAEEFYRGTRYWIEQGNIETVKIKEQEVFRECFLKWKSMQEVSDGKKEEYIDKLEKMIDGRVQAIVSGKYRNHYNSVAALVAALGEVKESLGKVQSKQMILQKYREQFPRYSSFIGELRTYGLMDVRRKR
ncbi:MAG: hypothetical protein IJN54_07725 [Lachnospiraceae bacterium]|nr:hypothetical protein [Lachnospiraceae bacterium]